MIPSSIASYLEDRDVPFERLEHPRAVSAQELAASVHVSGHTVAKSVVVEVGGQVWIAVLAACAWLDCYRLGRALGNRPVRLLGESELVRLFPDCELGAEPPFGGHYGLPVVVDAALGRMNHIVLRAGSHREAVRVRFSDYVRLEEPRVASFAVRLYERERMQQGPELHA